MVLPVLSLIEVAVPTGAARGGACARTRRL